MRTRSATTLARAIDVGIFDWVISPHMKVVCDVALLTPDRRSLARALARLHTVNPFSDERLAIEAEILGRAYVRPRRPRARDLDLIDVVGTTNQSALEHAAAELASFMRARLQDGARPTDEERELYKEVVFVTLFDRSATALDEVSARTKATKVAAYAHHVAAWRHFFDDDEVAAALLPGETPAHLFALFFQLRRAFQSIYRHLVGASAPMTALRASVWRSIFTVDPARYRRALLGRMHEIPTLVLGETGTGKELVARAIAGAAYVAFDADRAVFVGDHHAFFPISLAELPETLVESALFGHTRGAFTGATEDHRGVFALCPPEGTVFLDEVGELPPSVQVKLLRVLEAREASPLGSLTRFRFQGRVVAATHKDLAVAARNGRFRLDLFHRLAGDVIVTPTLRARVADDADELRRLAHHMCAGLVGTAEAASLLVDVEQILRRLGVHHAWPGNVRELSQLVRRVLVQGPHAVTDTATTAPAAWLDGVRDGTLPLDDVVTGYVRLVFAREGSVSAASRALGVDRRTVRTRLAHGGENILTE
jgi:DNA-binding NtrC family response regulator